MKKYYKMIIFNKFYLNLMHHGEYLKNNLWLKFAINNDLHLNLPLCYKIDTHMNHPWNLLDNALLVYIYTNAYELYLQFF